MKAGTPERVLAATQLPDGETAIRLERLRYAKQLFQQGDQTLWAILSEETSWLHQLLDDLNWLCTQEQGAFPRQPALLYWTEWKDYLENLKKGWSTILKRTMMHAVGQRSKELEWQQWQEQVLDVLESTKHKGHEQDIDYKIQTRTGLHLCSNCRISFSSRCAWAVHAFRKHDRVTEARLVAKGTACPICLKEFHEHVRYLRHLRHSHQCRAATTTLNGLVASTPAQGSRKEVTERYSRHVRPVLKIQGPSPATHPTPTQRRLGRDPSDFEVQMAELCYNAIERPWQTVEELVECFRKELQQTTMHLDDIPAFLDAWVHEVYHDNPQGFEVHYMTAIDAVCERLHPRWLFPNETWYEQHISMAPRPTPQQRINTLAPEWPEADLPVPKHIRSKAVVMIHVFSGRRRLGDMQHHAEQDGLSTGIKAMPLSVDIVIDQELGNMLHTPTLSLLRHAIRHQRIHCGHAGPPCETVSTAREIAAEGKPGPRPVRCRFYKGYQHYASRSWTK